MAMQLIWHIIGRNQLLPSKAVGINVVVKARRGVHDLVIKVSMES